LGWRGARNGTAPLQGPSPRSNFSGALGWACSRSRVLAFVYSAVTLAHTTCRPAFCGPVQQYLSRKKPVRGATPQSSRGRSRTFLSPACRAAAAAPPPMPPAAPAPGPAAPAAAPPRL